MQDTQGGAGGTPGGTCGRGTPWNARARALGGCEGPTLLWDACARTSWAKQLHHAQATHLRIKTCARWNLETRYGMCVDLCIHRPVQGMQCVVLDWPKVSHTIQPWYNPGMVQRKAQGLA